MIEPKVLVKGPFKPEDIHIKFNKSSNRRLDREIEREVKLLWSKIYKEAKKAGRTIWDGETYRLDEYQMKSNLLHITVSKLRYSIKKPLNELAGKLAVLGEDYFAKTIAVGGPIETTDGQFVFGKKSGKTMYLAPVDFIGGIVDSIELKCGNDLILVNKKEILEEINVASQYISDMKLAGIVLSNHGNAIFITYTKLNIDSLEVKKLFTSRKDEELSEIVFVDREQLYDYLEKLGGYRLPAVKLLRQLRLS